MEYTRDLFDKTSKILNNFNGFIEEGTLLKLWGVIDSQVIFAQKNLEILSSGKLDIYKNTPTDTGFASYIVFKNDGKIVNLLNVHGKTRPGHKMDTPARIKQSQKIIKFMKDKSGLKIIGGDFNLNPDTKSVRLFEEAGYKNLIKDFGIENTRNKLTWEQFPNEEKQHFADYVFVSPDVNVKNFEVPYTEVSDHLPQILEFEV